MTPEDRYALVEASGHVAQATGELLAWLHAPHRDTMCRLCGWVEGHNPEFPCGALRAGVEAMGAAVRAIVGR